MGWNVLPTGAQVLAVHAALLHTGQILYFGGDEHDAGQNDRGQIDHTRLFDCTSLTVSVVGSPTSDLFCSGHAFLMDGRLLVAGGTEDFPTDQGPHAPHFPGLRDASIFDPGPQRWLPVASMNPEPGRTTGGGRWYPTLLTLASGTLLALSGHPQKDDSRHSNDSPEAFSPSPWPTGTWRLLSGSDPAHDVNYYPRRHVLPGGDVLCATPVGGRTQRLTPAPYRWRDVTAAPSDPIYHGFAATSVLLPLLPSTGYRPRVLFCGGAQPIVLDLGAASPAWKPTGPRTLSGRPVRNHANAVLLPTGEVFVCGGAVDPSNDATGVLQAEAYNPDNNTWTTHPAATVVRNYHSVALLMPDGRVWTAGSNHNAQQSFPAPGVDNRELRIEIYEPPYYSADRPQLLSAPGAIGWGQSFDIRSSQADRIVRIAMIRAGSVTHAFNSDQRYVGLSFSRRGAWLTVKAPPNTGIAPPGQYLLFVLNRDNIPSIGWSVRLGPAARSSGFLAQSSFGGNGNFELALPVSDGDRGGLVHFWRNNDDPSLPWIGPAAFGTGAGPVEAVALLQSNFGNPGNLEVVARIGDRLASFWRESGPPFAWHGPMFFASGVSGNPAMIQGVFGGRGDFELVVPLSTGGLAHFRRDNDDPSLPWVGPTAFGVEAGPVEAVALLQSNFGDPGNLEVVARVGDRLALFSRESDPPFSWRGPTFFFSGASGVSGIMQSNFGDNGNFELVTPLQVGGVVHLWRNNDAPELPWSPPSAPFAIQERVLAASLMESSFGTPGSGGNLEVILRSSDDRYLHYWRQDGPPWNWTGPTAVIRG